MIKKQFFILGLNSGRKRLLMTEEQSLRMVVKVGTSTLTRDNGSMNLRAIDRLAMVLADLHGQGHQVILVSSGAIGVGVGKLGLGQRPRALRMKQAVAAVGQCELCLLYTSPSPRDRQKSRMTSSA